MRLPFTLACCLALISLAAPARADVVDPGPSSCPRGGRPESSHAGPYCAIKSCSGPAACKDPELCSSEALCIVTLSGGSMGGPFTVKSVVGSCDAQGSCARGSCEQHQVCAPPADDGTPKRGCECGVGDVSSATGLLLLLAVGLRLSLRRRSAERSADDPPGQA
jgi:MYXO-CTERM domain-containing protein